MNVWAKIRTRVGALGLTAGVLVIAGTATAAAMVVNPASDQTPAGSVFVTPSDTPTATTTDAAAVAVTPEPTTPAPASAPEPQPVTAQAPTVQTVTEPAPQAPAPAVVDPQSIGTTDEHGNYKPAPPIQRPGEPSALPEPAPPTAPPMPGEPGYAPPAN